MKILAFATTFWDDDPALAAAKKPELAGWFERVVHHFDPVNIFLATGCQDNVMLNPLRERPVFICPSGEPKTKPYDVFRWSYFLCAFEAALWQAAHYKPWDLLVELESNCFINPNVNMPALLKEFMMRPQFIMAPGWHGRPDFNFLVMKPAAVPAFLHHRKRGNLVDYDKPRPMMAEDELAVIFKDRWWNPFPKVQTIRQHWGIKPNPPDWDVVPDEIAKDWPCVALPSPGIQRLFS